MITSKRQKIQKGGICCSVVEALVLMLQLSRKGVLLLKVSSSFDIINFCKKECYSLRVALLPRSELNKTHVGLYFMQACLVDLEVSMKPVSCKRYWLCVQAEYSK
jgi:hypothetical protein